MENQASPILQHNVPVEQTPIPPPAKVRNPLNWVKFLIFTVVVLFIVTTVGVGSFLLGSNKNTPTKTMCTMEAKLCPDGSYVGRTGPKCEFLPCPTLTVDPAANWKTYASSTFGYSVKYPATLSFSTSVYQGIGGNVNTDTWTSQDKSYSINVYSYKIGVNSKLGFNLQPQPTTTIQLANQAINKIVSVDETLIQVGPIQNAGNEYMVAYSSGIQKNSEGQALLNQILSTFKFTTCIPRPACLDATPRCLIPETADMCPRSQ